jgi:succinate dehydrogenase/fumarate reductase cytochrome b subunit
MKKFLAPVAGALAASQMLVLRAYAALPVTDVPGLSSDTDIKGAIVNIITKILDFILIIAILFVIIAGIRLIVSGGDEAQKDKAKQTIIYVIAGIIVVLFARVIVVAVNNAFG